MDLKIILHQISMFYGKYIYIRIFIFYFQL